MMKEVIAVRKQLDAPFVQSLDRGLSILQSVAESTRPLSLGDIAKLLEIDRSSAFRLAQTLRRRGFLSCPAGRKDYILGSSMWTLSQRYDWGSMLVQVAHQELKGLAERLNETAHLAIREGTNSLFIDCAQANHVIVVAGRTGELVPLHCTAHGKALLADYSEKDLLTLFGPGPLQKFTKQTVTSVPALAKACAAIKKDGFAPDEAEHRDDLRCVAAPIRLKDSTIIGSIGISAPATRFPQARYQPYARQVCKVAQHIGNLLSNPESAVSS